jgi:hypothetical protein
MAIAGMKVLNRFGEECRFVDLWGRLPTCRPVVNRPRGGKQPPRSLTSCPTGPFELINPNSVKHPRHDRGALYNEGVGTSWGHYGTT